MILAVTVMRSLHKGYAIRDVAPDSLLFPRVFSLSNTLDRLAVIAVLDPLYERNANQNVSKHLCPLDSPVHQNFASVYVSFAVRLT